MEEKTKLYGFKVDMGLMYKVPITFIGPIGLTIKQQYSFVNKIIKKWKKKLKNRIKNNTIG